MQAHIRMPAWFLVCVLGASGGNVAAGQNLPDFSGNWTLARDRSSQTLKGAVVVSVSGLLGEQFTARQDARTLTLVISAMGRQITAAYNLDGSESKNMNPGAPGQPDEPIVSRASWEADRLVILTKGTALVNGKPLETKRVIWIDADGLLTIERSTADAPTLRSVYRRTGPQGPKELCTRIVNRTVHREAEPCTMNPNLAP